MSDELREKVAATLRSEVQRMIAEGPCSYELLADAAIALVRDATLEEAAKHFGRNILPWHESAADVIRAMKEERT